MNRVYAIGLLILDIFFLLFMSLFLVLFLILLVSWAQSFLTEFAKVRQSKLGK
jgi:hypothetical protein